MLKTKFNSISGENVVPTYHYGLKTGISRSKEFEKKGLAEFGINVGLSCGHQCSYCSSRAMFRCHKAFGILGLNPFDDGYAIVDPETEARVKADAASRQKRGLVMLSTATDAWSPEARRFGLGRACARAILSESGWQIRVLSKSAQIVNDFDLFEKYRDRVLVGLSTSFLPEDAEAASIVEPFADAPPERYRALLEAGSRGLRTYGMLCPMISPFYNTYEKIERAFKLILPAGPEEIFVEPVNPRGRGLIRTAEYLRRAGLAKKASAVERLRQRKIWSRESRLLIKRVIEVTDLLYERDRLRVLLYGSNFEEHDRRALQETGGGLIWL